MYTNVYSVFYVCCSVTLKFSWCTEPAVLRTCGSKTISHRAAQVGMDPLTTGGFLLWHRQCCSRKSILCSCGTVTSKAAAVFKKTALRVPKHKDVSMAGYSARRFLFIAGGMWKGICFCNTFFCCFIDLCLLMILLAAMAQVWIIFLGRSLLCQNTRSSRVHMVIWFSAHQLSVLLELVTQPLLYSNAARIKTFRWRFLHYRLSLRMFKMMSTGVIAGRRDFFSVMVKEHFYLPAELKEQLHQSLVERDLKQHLDSSGSGKLLCNELLAR